MHADRSDCAARARFSEVWKFQTGGPDQSPHRRTRLCGAPASAGERTKEFVLDGCMPNHLEMVRTEARVSHGAWASKRRVCSLWCDAQKHLSRFAPAPRCAAAPPRFANVFCRTDYGR